MLRRAKSNGTAPADAENAALRRQARGGGKAAIEKLLELAGSADSDSVKLGAIKELLDRGFGRVSQGEQTGAIVAHLVIDDGYGS